MEKNNSLNEKFVRHAGPADHMANERTFLSWIRTSIALMGFGFVVVRFAFYTPEFNPPINSSGMIDNTIQGKGPSALVGAFMVALGALISILSYIRYSNIEKQLNNNLYFPSKWLSAIVSIFIVIGSILLLWYLFPNVKL